MLWVSPGVRALEYEKKGNKMQEKDTDKWFEFVEEYYAHNTVPLSYVLLPDSATPSYRTPGSPTGFCKLSKREYNKLIGGNEK